MPSIQCSVDSCYKSIHSKHRFPNPSKNKSLFDKWVLLSGNKRLVSEMTPDKIYSNCRICSLHFLPEDFGTNKTLIKGAFPKVNLPVPLEPAEDISSSETTVTAPLAVSTKTKSQFIITDLLKAQFEKPKARKEIVAVAAAEPSTSKEGIEEYFDPEVEILQGLVSSITSCDNRPTTPTLNLNVPAVESSSSKRKRSTLLSEVNVSRVKDLTPKARHLYERAVQFKKRAALSRRSKLSFKQRLSASERFTDSEVFERCVSSMDRIRTRFFQSQIENADRKPKGRRYTLEDQVLALALYKQTGSGYRFLSKLFALPSRKTVMKLLNRIPIRPGLHEAVFSVLKAEARNFKNPQDRHCVLMFDEISIQPSLQLNYHEGRVIGFEDLGFRRTEEIANHAQVFMLRGIRRKWKQPVYYNFVNSATKKNDLVNIIKQIVRKCHSIGLNIIATVCDQGTNNRSAIQRLVDDTKAKYLRQGTEFYDYHFEIDDRKVIPLYDVPHIFKCLRNNFLKYNISFKKEDGITKLAKWDHIYKAYQLDPCLGSLRLMPKITDAHVNPKKIQKMKVSKCTQVFSHSVAAAVNVFAFSETTVKTGEGEEITMEKSAADTADLLEFLDQLFDSLNGSSFNAGPGKTLRVAVKANSPHIKFWRDSLHRLNQMQFLNGGSAPPCLTNLKITIQNFQDLWKVLQSCNFTHLMPRTFNQDPLENFFGRIRQRGQRNTNPTATDFTYYYKSLLVKQLTSSQSVGANCEDDKSEVFLTLQRLVSQGLPEDEESEEEEDTFCEVPDNVSQSTGTENFIETQALRYVSGYLIKKIGSTKCNCTELFLKNSSDIEDSETFIRAKEYIKGNTNLKYVNSKFLGKIKHALAIIKYIFNRDLHKKKIVRYTLKTLRDKISLTQCHHDAEIKTVIFTYLIKLKLFNYTKQINRVIRGLDLRPIPINAPKFFLSAQKIKNVTKLRDKKTKD